MLSRVIFTPGMRKEIPGYVYELFQENTNCGDAYVVIDGGRRELVLHIDQFKELKNHKL